MSTQFDVVVLGGGVAGVAAAIAASRRGARTCVVAGVPGSTALFSGAWRGECPDGLRRALADVAYELEPCGTLLPHCHGHLMGSDVAPPSHAAARLTDGALVVGIAGLPGFDAVMLARQWSLSAGLLLVTETVILDDTPPAGWAPASLAAHIERMPDVLVKPLQRALSKHGAQHAILPALIGMHYTGATGRAVGAAIGATVGEALAVPPSVPGWRLHNALRAALNTAGVSVIEGKAVARGRRDGRVDEIELLNGDVIAARTFVLATGKYAAGGIEVDGAFRETAFGCPVWVEHLGDRFETVDSLMLTDPARTEDQPLLRAGVHTDAEQRPVNAANDVVYSNVLVAGSIRAGWTSATHTMGDAASDGWAAGLKAVS